MGQFEFQTCPPGSLFDPVVLYCVPEEQATCSMNYVFKLIIIYKSRTGIKNDFLLF